jgi:hypothetical protein
MPILDALGLLATIPTAKSRIKAALFFENK